MEESKLTLGQKRIRVNFNVSGNSEVDIVKIRAAADIDYLESLKHESTGEKIRLISLAQTAYEEAAMWAVKALTI